MSERNKHARINSAVLSRAPRDKNVVGFISVVVLVLIWVLVTWKPFVPQLFLPGPVRLLEQLRQGPSPFQWLQDLTISTARVSSAFAIACLVSLPLGLGIGSSPRLSAVLSPLVEMARYIPVPALLPLCILWFGIGDAEKVTVILLGTLFQLTLSVALAVQSVPVGYIETGLTLGLPSRRILLAIVFPAAAPMIYDAVRVSFGWAWSYLVVAETVGSSGIGYRLMASQRYLQTGLVFTGLAELAALGWFSDWLFRRFRTVVMPWTV